MELQNRKPNRLSDFDYSASGYYFITICTAENQKILCNIVGDDALYIPKAPNPVGDGALDVPKIILSDKGKIVKKYIESSNNISNIGICKYVIMPNHIHILVNVKNNGNNGTSRAPSPTNSTIPHFVSTLKRFVNKDCGKNIFQRSFYDHIIRDEKDYLRIVEYIENNPAKWAEDKYFVL